MTAPAQAVFDRARLVAFPPCVVGGSVREGPGSWWDWVSSAPPAEIAEAHRALDAFERDLHECAMRLCEDARRAADRLQPTAFDDHLDQLVTETLKNTPRAAAGLSPGYYSSEQAARDREAEAALAALEAKAP